MALATAGTALRIPVDVAGGHVFKGHTLASTDLLCLLTPTGWKVVSATYADNAQQTYCTATITAVGAIPVNTVCYVVVPATVKIAGVPVIGAAQVSITPLIRRYPPVIRRRGRTFPLDIRHSSGRRPIELHVHEVALFAYPGLGEPLGETGRLDALDAASPLLDDAQLFEHAGDAPVADLGAILQQTKNQKLL